MVKSASPKGSHKGSPKGSPKSSPKRAPVVEPEYDNFEVLSEASKDDLPVLLLLQLRLWTVPYANLHILSNPLPQAHVPCDAPRMRMVSYAQCSRALGGMYWDCRCVGWHARGIACAWA